MTHQLNKFLRRHCNLYPHELGQLKTMKLNYCGVTTADYKECLHCGWLDSGTLRLHYN